MTEHGDGTVDVTAAADVDRTAETGVVDEAAARPGFGRIARGAWGVLTSLKLSVALLVGLMVLTWLGTLYQVEHGLWEAQKRYFESLVVFQHPADVWVDAETGWLERIPFVIPLPGGMTLMVLLFVNMVAGGFVRMLQHMGRGVTFVRRVGVLVVHAGILLLLVSAFVKHQTAVEGSLSLYEGQSSATYHSFHEWEIAVQRQASDGAIEELLIPGEDFLFLRGGRRAVFHTEGLPFEVVVEAAARNAEVRPAPQLPADGREGVGGEGFVLVGKPLETANERNLAGAVVSIRSADERLDGARACLHGMDRAPWTVASSDGVWALHLRKKMYPLPFAIQLDDFEAEMYPGTRKPKSFRSRVTVREPGAAARKVLIQMNEPLRAGGLVVYQSSWGPQGAGPNVPLFSGFQVVENVTDQWPLWSCIIIAVGMAIAFGSSLLRFVWREARAAAPAAAGLVAPLGVALALAVAAGPGVATAQGVPPGHPEIGKQQVASPDALAAEPVRTEPWPEEVVAMFRELPVQSDGRVKPFYTEVRYLLLRLHGTSQLRLPDDPAYGSIAASRIGATEWAMDALFFPAQCDRYRTFLVQSSEVLDAIEVEHDGRKKRDRYSFEELRPGFAKLFDLAQRYDAIPEKERSGLEEQVVALARNVKDYDRLVRSFDAVRVVFRTDDAGEIGRLMAPGAPAVRFSQLMAHWPAVRGRLTTLSRTGPEEMGPEEKAEFGALTRYVSRTNQLASAAPLLRWIPPRDPDESEWCAAAELIHVLDTAEGADPTPVLDVLAHHEALLNARTDAARFTEQLTELKADLDAILLARGEGAKIAMEVDYLLADYKYRALLSFGAAFVTVLLCWFRPRSRWLALPPWLLSAVGLVVLVQGIVMRCIIRERPPISTLYDTIVFIAAACVVSALALEAWHRRKVFLSLAALLGFVGMFLAARFELSEGRDTMPTLIAVLDTNFWLATHVTVINLGYAGALLAGFIAHVYLFGEALGHRAKDPAFFRAIGRATYGTVCFAALFSTVGTILGGIWANDSWGRFWGWDPKENGALMIVLWCLAILHARMGGLVKDHGIAMLAVAGNLVVVFSWFHTNLLGVGLHSYGFASGLATAVWTFYALQLAVLVVGWWGHRRYVAAARGAPSSPGVAAT